MFFLYVLVLGYCTVLDCGDQMVHWTLVAGFVWNHSLSLSLSHTHLDVALLHYVGTECLW